MQQTITAEETTLEIEIQQHINFSDYYTNIENETPESAAQYYYLNESLWHLKTAANLNEKLRKLRSKNIVLADLQLQSKLS